ncbi:hypothetical protein N9F34_04960, partial [Alphaproteobacteria bacterium]|nr:hypothetical protein [Alphaproteobacteria bacterium]
MTAPRLIVEIGTCWGFSSYIWAENTADDTRVVTVDLALRLYGEDYARPRNTRGGRTGMRPAPRRLNESWSKPASPAIRGQKRISDRR